MTVPAHLDGTRRTRYGGPIGGITKPYQMEIEIPATVLRMESCTKQNLSRSASEVGLGVDCEI